MKAFFVKVTGRVQRVGYRTFVLDTAQEIGLAGTVRNLEDGSVAIHVQGEDDEVAAFIERARAPPAPARVTSFDASEVRLRPKLKVFKILTKGAVEEFQEGLGAMDSIFRQEFGDYRHEFRDYREEFRDYREEFRDFARRTDENFKHLESKYGEISEKLTNIMNTLIEESKKTREMLEVIKSDSRQTREMLSESMRLLREAIDRMPKQG